MGVVIKSGCRFHVWSPTNPLFKILRTGLERTDCVETTETRLASFAPFIYKGVTGKICAEGRQSSNLQ